MPDSMPTVPYADVPPPPAPGPYADLQEWGSFLLALQAPACRILGSHLYAELLQAAADDVRGSGATWQVLAPHVQRTTDDALALRFMAAVHRLVLTGSAPALEAFFSSTGGDPSRAGAWPVLRDALAEHAEQVSQWVALPCQTNEVGRSAALAAGFLAIAADRRLPLRLLEIGASGGLNLRWDHYRYTADDGSRSWGHPASPVVLRGHWDVPTSLTTAPVRVSGRAGCDPAPVDPLSDDGRLRLTASIWGDQPARFERFRGALEVAARVAVQVDRAHAADWLPAHLDARDGEATVVYHSVVLQYLDARERDDVVALISRAGARATPGAPMYWLRMEPESLLRAMSLRLTAWPGGHERLLATAGAHGFPVRWRDQPAERIGTPRRRD